jgi:hypothetical protein
MTSLENVTASQIEEIASALAVAYAAVKCSESPVPGWMEKVEKASAIVVDLQIDAIIKERQIG